MTMGNLCREAGGRFYDHRLGSLIDETYEFAEKHGMELEPRYDGTSIWFFFWEENGICREIQINILEEPRSTELQVYNTAWFDDPDAGKRYLPSRTSRGYILRMPVDRKLFRETLEMAYKDATSHSMKSLDEFHHLSTDPDRA